jgi:hypothetical protein
MSTDDNNVSATDCPPAEAEQASGDVFRCCKTKSPRATEMQTHEETGRLPDADPCLRRALSVFREQRDAEHQVRLFRRWKRRFIVKAALRSSHGRVMLTKGKQPSHTSWWPMVELEERASLFTLVCEVHS